MTDILQMLYLWLKAAHLIFVIFWMAGLFMLPRFLVYHQEAEADSAEAAAWAEREAKLRKIILLPSVIIVWALGITLAFTIGAWPSGWFHAKLLLVLLLTGYHGWMVGYARKLAQGRAGLSNRSLRMVNEIPGVAAALIVILAIVKPF